MLFDLSSPGRKNVVRVVFGLLALLFAIGFIGFGIGGELGGGGIIDSITGDGSGGDTADQFEQQIEDSESTLEADPENQRALANLSQYRYLSGQAQLEVDEATGQITGVSDESRGEFEKAVAAWERYIATDPPRVDITTATNAVNAYRYLEDAGGAAEAQAFVAKANPNSNAYVNLALLRYADQDFKGAEAAGELALKEAKDSQRKQVEKVLDQYRKAAEKYKKQLAKQPQGDGGTGLENPFGGFGSGGALPPTAP